MMTPTEVERRLLNAWGHIMDFAETVVGEKLPLELTDLFIATYKTGVREEVARGEVVQLEAFSQMGPESLVLVNVVAEVEGRSVGIYSDFYIDTRLIPHLEEYFVDEFTIVPTDVTDDEISDDTKAGVEEVLKTICEAFATLLAMITKIEEEKGKKE